MNLYETQSALLSVHVAALSGQTVSCSLTISYLFFKVDVCQITICIFACRCCQKLDTAPLKHGMCVSADVIRSI